MFVRSSSAEPAPAAAASAAAAAASGSGYLPEDAPLDPEQQVQLTPHEVREEREHERTRRRLALRKKAERSGRGRSMGGSASMPATPNPNHPNADSAAVLLLSGTSMLHPNDLTHVHPSMQHQLASAAAATASASTAGSLIHGPSSFGAARVRPFAAAAAAAAASSSSSFASASASRFGGEIGGTGIGIGLPTSAARAAASGFSSPTATGGLGRGIGVSSNSTASVDHHHRIDIASAAILGDPSEDDEANLLERAQTTFWRTIHQWSAPQRVRAFQWVAGAYAATGVAYSIMVASTLDTAFANPPLHYTACALAAFLLALAWFLRWATKPATTTTTPAMMASPGGGAGSGVGSVSPSGRSIDLTLVLLWTIGSVVAMCALVLLAIIAFHHDRQAVEENLRRHAAGEMAAGTTTTPPPDATIDNAELDVLSQLRSLSAYHFHLLGGASAATILVLAFLTCVVSTLRLHILADGEHADSSTARQRQYAQRLKNRQRMARLGAQMKERRRMRKLRATRALSAGGPVGVGGAAGGSGAHSQFTGLGTGVQGGSWSQDSAPEDTVGARGGGGGGGAGGDAIQMTQIHRGPQASSSPAAAAAASAASGGGADGAGVTLPLLPQPDADEQRYAGMLSEDIEDELERAEQRREAQHQQQMQQAEEVSARAIAFQVYPL